jgi:hypothetical protein
MTQTARKSEPEGFPAISRGSSEAIPPVSMRHRAFRPRRGRSRLCDPSGVADRAVIGNPGSPRDPGANRWHPSGMTRENAESSLSFLAVRSIKSGFLTLPQTRSAASPPFPDARRCPSWTQFWAPTATGPSTPRPCANHGHADAILWYKSLLPKISLGMIDNHAPRD